MSFNGVSDTLTSPSGHGRFGARPRLMSELMAIGYRRQGCAAAVDREGSNLSVLCPALSNVGQNGHLAQMIVLNRSFAVPALLYPSRRNLSTNSCSRFWASPELILGSLQQ